MNKLFCVALIPFCLWTISSAQSPEEILGKYTNTVGGKESWQEIKSFKITMLGRSSGQTATVEHYMLKPFNYKIIYQFPNLRRTLAYNDGEGIILENDSSRPMPEDMQVEMREEPDFYDELIFYKEKGYPIKKLKDTTMESGKYWKFALEKSKKDRQYYYINKENYLLDFIEEYSEEKKYAGTLFKTRMYDYQEIESVLFPMKMQLFKNNDLWISYELKRVELNATLDTSHFKPDLQSSKDKQAFWESISGKWRGIGQLMGAEAEFEMVWEKVLNDQFYQLTFQNKFVDKNGTERILKSKAFYNLTTDTGFWFDTRGMVLPLQLSFKGLKMTVLWGNENTEQGKTTYDLTSGSPVVEDFISRGQNYLKFGSSKYTKK